VGLHTVRLDLARAVIESQYRNEQYRSEHSTQLITHVPSCRLHVVLSVLRYSRDLSGYKCLTCEVSSHCSHFEDIRRGAQYEHVRDECAARKLEEEIQAAKQKARTDVLTDISNSTSQDGQWQPKGHSTQPFQTYSSSQKVIIGNRLKWLNEQQADELSSGVDPHGTLPHRMVDMTMMGQCIHES
jgi:hypothetical protein